MKNKLIIGAFALITAACITVLLLPPDYESVKSENRTASTMPPVTSESVFSGDFAAGVESFIGDSVGFRSAFMRLTKWLDEKRGFTPESGKIVSTNKDIGTGTTQKQTLLLVDHTIMEMFIKDYENEKLYTDAVNHYAEKLPENVKLYNMIIPTQLEFREPIYRNLQDSQRDAIDEMYGMLDERAMPVNLCDTLYEHRDEYIYFRTDHHWTQLGAYYGYRKFMETAGGEAVSKDDYEKNEIRNVLGYLYDRVEEPEIAADPDVIEWYDLDAENISVHTHDVDENGKMQTYNGTMYDRTQADYLFFFGSDHPILEITNEDNIGGRTIAVMKESYSNVFTPWLAQSYYKVIMVDPRLYRNDFQIVMDEFSPDEVLIANYIFTTNFADYCSLLKNMY